MSTMKQVCDEVGMTYETLRFYCDEGLVPDVKRDKNNYRVFDEHAITWIKGLQCLKKCGMSISDMKQYMKLCKIGDESIPERKIILQGLNDTLMRKKEEIEDSLHYIENKQIYYDDISRNKIH